jgi:hypothetical protein
MLRLRDVVEYRCTTAYALGMQLSRKKTISILGGFQSPPENPVSAPRNIPVELQIARS